MGFPWISSFCSLTVLGSWLVFTATTSAETPKSWVLGLFSQELRVLDARQQQLVAEAASLPESAAVNTGLRLGWHSQALRFSDSGAWVQVDLGGLWPVDTVALVAASGEAQGSQGGPGYGFPLRFRVELAEDEEFDMPMIVYDTGTEDVTNPGGLPIVIEAQGRRARFVRLNIFKPWPRREDWIVAIGEIIVLSGSRNVAAGQPARVSSSSRSLPGWSAENLTDGQCLLGPPVSTEPSPTNGYLAQPENSPGVTKWVQVDLGRAYPLDEVRLFPARPTDFADAPGSGFPPRFRVEASNDAGFSQPRTLFDTGPRDFIAPGENPVTLRGDGKPGRFVRVTATRLHDRGGISNFALAELEIWSAGVNTASVGEVTALDAFDNPQYSRWQPDYLVDGYSSRHRILDLPQWLSGLSRRREILLELHRIDSERRRVTEATLALLTKSAASLLGGLLLLAGGLLWRGQLAKRRVVEALRNRIAGDLHDEIGSQLGGIALAAQLAARRTDDLDEARMYFRQIERTARETNDAMHDIVWLLKPGSTTLEELVVRLRETTAVQLRDLEYQFEVEGVTPRRVGIDFTRHVYLLAKEALANITKHAQAHLICIHFRVANGTLLFTIHDDGTGFDPVTANPGNGLDNMRYRAAQLGGSLRIASVPHAGTTVTLNAPIR
jgi:signal transduction histidine kinase